MVAQAPPKGLTCASTGEDTTHGVNVRIVECVNARCEPAVVGCEPSVVGGRAVPFGAGDYFAARRRSELRTTNTDEHAIAALASMGESRPAMASGTISTL